MKNKSRPPIKVLLYQSLGFLAIIAVCLLDEKVNLTALIFGNQTVISNFRETILKMVLIFAVWLLVNGATRRVLARVHYLESFTKVCAWCRRVDFEGKWMPLEDFLETGFDTTTSHGICKDCLEKKKAALERDLFAKPKKTIPPIPRIDPMQT